MRELETPPILFVIFNRPEKTEKVFNEIRKVKPKKLYVACDGPRQSVPEDKKNVETSRDLVISNIDWNCEIHTLFRKKNVGLIGGYCGAISWFFKHEEMGIILEDDTLPDNSFFKFCGELLEKYKDDSRVMNICGFNIHSSKKYDDSYFFSYFPHAWGWATWRRSWNMYRLDLNDFSKIDRSRFSPTHSYNFFYESFKLVYEGKLNSCLLRWYFALATNNGLSIIPSRSLIKNIGLDESGTNFKSNNTPYAKIDRNKIKFPLIHPKVMHSDFHFDSYRIEEAREALKKNRSNLGQVRIVYEKVERILMRQVRGLKRRFFN